MLTIYLDSYLNRDINSNRQFNLEKKLDLNFDDFPVTVSQQVVWGEMDAFAHVNNVVYFRYFETGRMAYFERVGILSYLDETGLGPILASTSCDFLAPLSYPDDIKILTRIDEIKQKRFNMQSIVYSKLLDKIVARGQGMVVYYDYSKPQTCEVPAEIVASIKELEGA